MKLQIPKCPTCKQCLPESSKALVAARVKGPISPGRNDLASYNSFATDIMAAGHPNTATATVGDEPDRFDADWDGGVK